jgi:hypothetical protein
MLSLDVWVILVAEQPASEERQIAVQCGSCPDLKVEDYDHEILCPIGLDSVHRIVYMFKEVYRCYKA